MDLTHRIAGHFKDNTRATLDALELLAAPIAAAIETITECLLGNGKILVCGSGGAVSEGRHFAEKMVHRFEMERPPLAAIALRADPAALMGMAEDADFSRIFAKQVHALGQPGDVLLVLYPGGDARGVLEAMDAASEREMRIVALTGQGTGAIEERLRSKDVHIGVPADRIARVQEVHLLVLHCLCDGIDCLLMGVEDQ